MTNVELIQKVKAEIERRIKDNEKLPHRYIRLDEDKQLLSFIESLEKEPKGKTNPLFEECLANVDPTVRKEVSDNIDKMLEKEQDAPNIKGWVARDENGDLYAFVKKPERCLGEFELKDKTLWDDFTGNGSIRLPKELFPDLTWESDPLEVELTIHRVWNIE